MTTCHASTGNSELTGGRCANGTREADVVAPARIGSREQGNTTETLLSWTMADS